MRNIRRLLTLFAVLVAVLVAVLGGDASALAFSARVVSVADGDTLTVQGEDEERLKVRLYGIDAPEHDQRYGKEARRALSSLVRRKTVDVEPVDADRYGRTVALVRLEDGLLVNEELVARGAAWYYGQYCRRSDPCARLRDLEERARAARLGLWADDAPQRPSEWRREHKREEPWRLPARVWRKIVRKTARVFYP